MADTIISKLPRRCKDEAGNVYGRLTVLQFHGIKSGQAYWTCQCECGHIAVVAGRSMRNGDTRSCGCLRRERLTTHGQTDSPLYVVWKNMKSRCLKDFDKDYPRYGARGIAVIAEWMDFEAFQHWAVSAGYNGTLQLERVDNDGNYCPSNCRWATAGEQANNRRSNVVITHDGISLTAAQWSRRLGGERHLVSHRLKRGWTIGRAVTQPREIHDELETP